MELLAALAFLVVVFFCLSNPIAGLNLVVATGFLQDPVRKLIPGNAFYMVLAALAVFSFCFAGLLFGNRFRRVGRSRALAKIRAPILLFGLIVAVQSGNSLLRWESPVLAGIGFFSYVAPIAAAATGYLLGLRPSATEKLLRTYAVFGLGAGASVLLARAWPGTKVLSPIGEGMMVYGEGIGVVLASGLLRTAEVASWHAATAACVLLVLISIGESRGRTRVSLSLASAGTALLLVAVIFTGRRKAIGEVVFFLVVFAFLLVRRRVKVWRLGLGLGLAGVFLAYQLVSESGQLGGSSADTAYLKQRVTTFGTDAGTRMTVAFASTQRVFETYGLVGLGAGSIAQGSQYFGADTKIGNLAEAGLARVAAELGLPGLLSLLWVAARLFAALRRGLGDLARRQIDEAKLGFGLLSLVVANGLVFLTASQIFGDPFVYLLLGLFAGAVFGLVDGSKAEASERVTAPAPVVASATPVGQVA